MIITDKFILLNSPKTGSTFARKVIKTLYKRRVNNNFFRKIKIKANLASLGYEELLVPHHSRIGHNTQHGAFFQIPEKDKEKNIVSVIRNPYERFESQFHFKWWANHSGLEKKVLKRHFPKFPNISIDEYIKLRELIKEQNKLRFKIPEEIEIGNQTIQFIYMFFKNPYTVFQNLDTSYMQGEDFIKDMANITFLRQENLNEDLANFLAINGFHEKELEFVKNHKKINVTKKTKITKNKYNKNVIAYIEKSEYFLFKILENKKIIYSKPTP